jgi:photosystem II stability/assembly factor-like uncharacterized protein
LRQKAVEEKQQLAAAISGTSGQWSPIGPAPIQGGIRSGRVWGIAVDPRNSSVVYIGTDGGGVWKTTDAGTNWTPLTDQQANINIRDLTLAQSAPDTILAATAGGGILKSTDGGATWTISLSGIYVYSVAVHPTSASIVLATDFRGVWRSTDGGSTWTTPLPYGTNTQAQVTNSTPQVVFDPANGDIAYAATTRNGLYRSTDSGLTWNPVAGSGLPAGPYGYVNVSVAPSSTNILYLALKGSDYHLIGFYRSADSGGTWTQVGAPQNDDVTYWGWSLRVHPTNPNLIYAGSLRLSMSTDGGKTWAPNDNTVHVDHHAQAYSADGNTLYIGNDGGIWSTSNPTIAMTSWTSLNATLNTALFMPGISISPANVGITFGGTQDNGVLQYQANLAWREVGLCGDGGFTAIDFNQPQNLYATCNSSLTFPVVTASTDGGNSFHAAQGGINLQDTAAFYPPLVMDPSNPRRLYFGTNRVYQTLDGAGSWTAISSDLTYNHTNTIGTIAVAPSDPNAVYTGGVQGVIFMTRNALSGANATWTARNLPASQYVTQITVDPQNPLTAWAATNFASGSNGPVYRTTDGGATWITLRSGLPSIAVNDILVDPDISNTIYAATDVGVYRTVDNGQSWLPLGTVLPIVIAHSLRLDSPSRTLRAATYGRGMWDLSVPVSGQVAITIASTTPGANFSLEDGTTHAAPTSFYWYTGAQHTITWLNNPPGQTGARYTFQGWTDGVAPNARTIVVPSAAATYTANIGAQYLLSVTPSPVVGGAVAMTPPSADGYYNQGTQVQISATPAAGYGFWYLSGDLTGALPQSIAMNAPHTVTVNFYCQYTYPYFPSTLGSGSTAGSFRIQAGSACSWSLTSGANWLTLTSTSSGVGTGTVAYTVAANSGAARSTSLTIAGDQNYSYKPTVAQDSSTTGRPSVLSMQPNLGYGAAQSFTYQFLDPNGYSEISSAYMNFESSPYTNPACDVYVANSNVPFFNLLSDDGKTYAGTTGAPNTTVHNGQCTLDVSASSATGSGNILTVTISLTFNPAFSGGKLASASAYDSVVKLSSNTEMVGTWIAGTAPALTVAQNHAGNFTQGQPVAMYTISVQNLGGAAGGGSVLVTDALSPALTPTAIAGQGWTCTLGTVSCSRSDSLAAGAAYPPITVTTSVASNAPSQVINQVLVSGGLGSASASDVTAIQAPFTDVASNDSFLPAIDLLKEYAITHACQDVPLKYCPNDNITEAQMAVFVVRSVMGNDNFTYTQTPYFSDVPASNLYFPWIQKMQDLGIALPCASNQFCPDTPVTRGIMSVLIIRGRYGVATPSSYPSLPYFTDVGPSHPYFPWIQKMKQFGITSGCTATTYCPDDPVTRGQMAVFIMRGEFNQLLPASTPIVAWISSASASPGKTVTPTIVGQNTSFVNGVTQVNAGAGITVGNISVANGTTLTVQFAVATGAALGPRSITVTTGSEEATFPNGLQVQ